VKAYKVFEDLFYGETPDEVVAAPSESVKNTMHLHRAATVKNVLATKNTRKV
jgi:hypothetical protein